MLHPFEKTKYTRRERHFALSENTHQIGSQEYHDDSSQETEYSREDRIDADRSSECSEQSSEQSESDDSADMKECEIFLISHCIIILRNLRRER